MRSNLSSSILTILIIYIVVVSFIVMQARRTGDPVQDEGKYQEQQAQDPEKDASEMISPEKESQENNEGQASEENVAEQLQEGILDETGEKIEKLLGEMTLHEKVCQMILAGPEALTGVETATAAGEQTKEAMEEYPVGGVILYAKNLVNQKQAAEMITNLQKYAGEQNGINLFVGVDEEGGRVARVAEKLNGAKLDPMYEYREQGVEAAYENAVTLAKNLSQFGFNLDFAPVADTWSNPKNTVIGDRAYSDDYNTAAKLVAAAVEGFHSRQILCTLKHFPGHGDTEQDSHNGSAYVYKTREELLNEELIPFKAGIDAGADMVMVGHITLPKLDELPASLSYVIVNGILREELGYDGVVITDSLSMKALTDLYGEDKIAVMAVQAGNDLLLCQTEMKSLVSALEDAVANGEISEERIDQSVRRILRLKYQYGLVEKEQI